MVHNFVIWNFTLPHWLQGQIQGRVLPPLLFLDQTEAQRAEKKLGGEPGPQNKTQCALSAVRSPQSAVRSPQSTIHTLPLTLTVITTNRQILNLLAFSFVKFPWNQTFGCYYGPKTVWFSKKSEIRVTEMIWTV